VSQTGESDERNSFVICNDGYTIERYIHGWKESYNDIQPWKFVTIPSTFGGQPGDYETHQIRTRKELLDLFSNEDFSSNKCLQVSLFPGTVNDIQLTQTSSWNCTCLERMPLWHSNQQLRPQKKGIQVNESDNGLGGRVSFDSVIAKPTGPESSISRFALHENRHIS
jgi:hypothetical protein